MKKLLLACTIAFASSASFSASLAIGDTTAAAAGGPLTLTPTTCTFLKEDVKVASSKGVYGGVDCDTTAFGVAAGAPKGKKIIYSIGSGGGKITETSGTVPASTGVTSQATTIKTAT